MGIRSYLFVLAGAALIGAVGIRLLTDINARRQPATDRYSYVIERKMAVRIAAGKPVVLAGRINEWMLRWKIAERVPVAPEAAIFGSSHSLRVTANLVGVKNAMNFSISGSSLADYFVTVEILASRGLRPGIWVIFVAPWLFDIGADFGAWRERADDLLRIEARLARQTDPPLEMVYAASYAKFGKNRPDDLFTIEPLLHSLNGRLEEFLIKAQIGDLDDANTSLIRADGSLQLAADHDLISMEAIQKLAVSQFDRNPDRHRYGNYRQIDENLWGVFENWVRTCQQEGGRVWLVLSPYHPEIYPRIIARSQNQLQTIERRVHAFGQSTGVRVIGSYDPAKLGITDRDFFDGDHLYESGMETLFAPLRASSPAR